LGVRGLWPQTGSRIGIVGRENVFVKVWERYKAVKKFCDIPKG